MSGTAATTCVLDASAVLALVADEPGASRVEKAIERGALVSAVNWAEVVAVLVLRGGDPDALDRALRSAVPGAGVEIVPFDDAQARRSAALITKTRRLGLSLADRAALALALERRLPVVTADRAWRALRLPITIDLIRS